MVQIETQPDFTTSHEIPVLFVSVHIEDIRNFWITGSASADPSNSHDTPVCDGSVYVGDHTSVRVL
jgi:hypothetical protein